MINHGFERICVWFANEKWVKYKGLCLYSITDWEMNTKILPWHRCFRPVRHCGPNIWINGGADPSHYHGVCGKARSQESGQVLQSGLQAYHLWSRASGFLEGSFSILYWWIWHEYIHYYIFYYVKDRILNIRFTFISNSQ